MPKVQSQNALTAVTAGPTRIVAVTLITISHPSLDEPIRLSTDPTERLSVDPLRYGTRHRGNVYYYALVDPARPEQGQDAADTTTMVLDIVTPEMARLPGLSLEPSSVDLVEVMSNAPDFIESAFTGLETKSAEVDTDAGTISIEIGRTPLLDEPTCQDRMTADRFPGLHRR